MAEVIWGDGVVESLPFIHPNGDFQPVFNHTYVNAGTYQFSAFVFNHVSDHNFTSEIEIIQEIKDFEIELKFYMRQDSDETRDGYGELRNMFPLDKNVTFFPVMSSVPLSSLLCLVVSATFFPVMSGGQCHPWYGG
ncbi:uncharacterized protein LOC121853094 [Homarus americanus]|uniref:uncharacterized protein LOC121853094 n=1 Tax=Homarus americanus TaxID=6706 RepID=UPI001C45C9BF|nr:uncharacterized protein LOC121853094 [Homarus americanus]